jgi:3-oxoacyl-[acyl-carrier protein] reductase
MALKGKCALVTGAQQGIGRAAALELAAAGADVVINFLDDESAAAAIAATIESGGGRALVVQGTVTDTADVIGMMDAAEELGGIDILVNNAGIFPRVELLDLSDDDWDRVIDVNLKGSFRCLREAARRMTDHGRGGVIINLASSAAYTGPELGVHYGASKGGVIGMTRAAASALASHGIRVNAIAPGLTDTAQPRDGMNEEEISQAAAATPLGRLTQPEDIANAVVFLASDASRQMTGQILHVNAGLQFR